MSGEDQKFHWAMPAILNDEIDVRCGREAHSCQVCMVFKSGPLDLHNNEGWPLALSNG